MRIAAFSNSGLWIAHILGDRDLSYEELCRVLSYNLTGRNPSYANDKGRLKGTRSMYLLIGFEPHDVQRNVNAVRGRKSKCVD